MTRHIGTAAALLLSTAMLDFVRGSFSAAGDDKVFSDFVVVRGQVQKNRAQDLKHTYLPQASTGTTTTTTALAGGDQIHPDLLAVNHAPLSKLIRTSAINSRGLQALDCSDGTTSILVSSTVFPLVKGCFSPVDSDGTTIYAIDGAAIAPVQPTTSTDPPIWAAVYLNSADELVIVCISAESADDVDPSEATWICDSDGDGSGSTPTDDEFSVSCGCSITSPSPAVTPAPVQSNTTEPTCGEGDSFSISSATLPDTEGCYQDAAEVINDKPVYSVSGTTNVGQIFMFVAERAVDDTSTTATFAWTVVNVVSTNAADDVYYCISGEETPSDHPSDVPEWICGEGTSIEVDCGCSGTASTGTPSPLPSPATGEEPQSIASTCPGDKSFTITANAAPELSGCFTGSTNPDGLFVYIAPGATTESEIHVFDVENDAGDFPSRFNWYIWSISLTNSEDNSVYCISVELSTDVNPGDASWFCDFTGDAANAIMATEDDISIVCGSCGTVVSTSQPAASPVSAPTATPASLPTSPTTAEPPISRALPTTAPSAPAPAPSPATGGEPQSTANTCPGDKSFTITATAAPELSGCFIGTTDPDGVFTYTVSGTTIQSEVFVIDLANDDGDFNWYIFDMSFSNSDDPAQYCLSAELSTDVNPGGASWICDFTGNQETFSTATQDEISIVCGSCTTTAVGATPQPSTSPVSPLTATTLVSPPTSPTAAEPPTSRALPTTAPFSRTPAPMPASDDGEPALIANTCSGDGSFTITANAAPNLDGCFEDTSFPTGEDGSVFYTLEGTTGNAEITVSSGESDSGDFVWSISDNISGDSQTLCVSTQSASIVNPGNAAWNCDFHADGDNFRRVADEDISVVCGACAD